MGVGRPGLGSLLRINETQLREEIPHINQVIVEDLLCFVEELEDRGIPHRIEDALSLFPTFDDVAFAQDRQLLGKGTLLNPQPGTQVVDAHFPLAQSIEDLDPQRMRKGFEELGSESGKFWHL